MVSPYRAASTLTEGLSGAILILKALPHRLRAVTHLNRTALLLFETDVRLRKLERASRASPGDQSLRRRLIAAFDRNDKPEAAFGARWHEHLSEMGRMAHDAHTITTKLSRFDTTLSNHERWRAEEKRHGHLAAFDSHKKTILGGIEHAQERTGKETPEEQTQLNHKAEQTLGRIITPEHAGNADVHKHALLAVHGFKSRLQPTGRNYPRNPHGYLRLGSAADSEAAEERLKKSLDYHGHLKTHEIQSRVRSDFGAPGGDNVEHWIGLNPKASS